jgi:hypothetical protein
MASSKSGTLGLPVLAPQTGAHIAGNASGGAQVAKKSTKMDQDRAWGGFSVE